MATLRELIIKISANSSSFQSEISRAQRMGADYYKTMEGGGRKATAATRESQRAIAALNGELASVKATATGLAGAFAGAFATGQLIHYADTWNQLSGRLRLASTGTDDFTESQRALMDISQRTGTSFEANANLYSRIASALRDAGYASSDVAKVTETVATSLKLSGASTEEASSVITQLSQALGSGVLRGEEFNAIMENGGRLAKLLASGLGTTIGGLRNMANNGQLTTDKIIPLLTNVDQLRKEFDTLPASISGSAQKVENAFMAWVGGANNALGASSALAGGLDSLADNIGEIAAVAGVLAAVGGSRMFGNMITGATTATAKLIEARGGAIALADAQNYAAVQAQRKAVADAEAAKSAYNLALAEANVAKGSNAEALATDNLIKKRSEMIAANAKATQSNMAVAASHQALNRATSVVGTLGGGARLLLSLVGGIPGALMLGAGAWYTMYQNQEEARRSAQEYASQIDIIREKTSKMSLTDTEDNRKKSVDALAEQNRLIDEQSKKIDELKRQIDQLNKSQSDPSLNNRNREDIIRAVAIATGDLAVEQERLNQLQERAKLIQQSLEENERRHNDLIREQAGRQNALYQSMLVMNGQHTEFNRLLGLGNQLLMARQGMTVTPLRVPQATATQKQIDALEKSRRELALSRLKGEEKERTRLGYTADDLGLTADPQFQTNRAEFINNGLEEWRNNEANKKKPKGPKTDEEKAVDTYDRLIKQQKEQIALEGQNTELAKVKYQVSQGELSTLSDAQKQTLLQNAALIDQTKIKQQLIAYENSLADANATALAANQAQLAGYGQGTRLRERMQEEYSIRQEFGDKNTDLLRQYQAKEISQEFYEKGIALNKEYLDQRLRDQQAYYEASDAQRADWGAGMREGFSNWADEASDYASQTANLVSSSMDGLVGSISDALSGNKSSWDDWANSVLRSMQKILINAMLVDSLKSASSSGGLFSSIGGMFGSLFGGGSSGSSAGAGQSFAVPSFRPNAKGGVYASESLSAYSNSVVNTPTYFAFAKGAGLMGEAGPEAIMPLTRSADGSLGVRMVGAQGANSGGGSTIIHQHFSISGNGDAALKQAMQEAARQGAQDGAKQARQELLQDFQTRGQARRLLNV
ncbi:phage tail tape measure protein [Kosakonia sp. R1.Fl]|uniref:phage tail tape measure protein n=1 Tax=Kosakonia sp. R1.Fl TaxID=2928706 RepID=UPI00201E4C9A|nr:phage tail tape measure protein [Kosakonia sp. R1.Fl]MCL6744440.1 phage tail tape measure protein [Kosakonia sp. R1.Fl]